MNTETLLAPPYRKLRPTAVMNAYKELRQLSLRLALLLSIEEESQKWHKNRVLHDPEMMQAIARDIESGAIQTIDNEVFNDDTFALVCYTAKKRSPEWRSAVKQAQCNLIMATSRGWGVFSSYMDNWDENTLNKKERARLNWNGVLYPVERKPSK